MAFRPKAKRDKSKGFGEGKTAKVGGGPKGTRKAGGRRGGGGR